MIASDQKSLFKDSFEGIGEYLVKHCRASSLSTRIPVLEELNSKLQDSKSIIEDETLKEIAGGLTCSYAFIRDPKSAKLITSIYEGLFLRSPALLESVNDFVLDLVSKNPGGKALTDYLNLLDWTNAFLRFLACHSTNFKQESSKVLHSLCLVAFSIETALDDQELIKRSKQIQNQHRKRLRQSILQSISKTLAFCLKNGREVSVEAIIENVLEKYTATNLSSTGVLIVVGALTKAAVQVLPSQPAHYSVLEEKFAERLCEFVGKEVILAKEPPSRFCIETFLTPFAQEYVTADFYRSFFIPNMEKCILRSSETGLVLSAQIYSSVDANKIDLCSVFVGSKLMSQSFTSLKSNKEQIRAAALRSFTALLKAIQLNNCLIEDMNRLISEVFKSLKSNLNTEYKIMASTILLAVPVFNVEVSTAVINGLTVYVTKELNETALESMLKAYFAHFSILASSEQQSYAAIKAGLNDKKPQVRRLWVLSLLEVMDCDWTDGIVEFSEEILTFIKETLSAPSRSTARAVLNCLICVDRFFGLQENKFGNGINSLTSELYESYSSLGHAWLMVTMSANIEAERREFAVHLLSRAYERSPLSVGFSVIKALKEEMTHDFSCDKDGITVRYATPVLTVLAQKQNDTTALKKVLIELLAIAQYPAFKLKNGWAAFVLQAGLEPNQLVGEFSKDIISTFKQITSEPATASSPLGHAAIRSISYAAFINSSAVTPLIEDLLKQDLNAEQLSKIDDSLLDIWRGTDGQLVVNVLETKEKRTADKNSKDYETLKWEEEIRKKQAKKGTVTKKLSKEEKAVVDAQIAKESEIRQNVSVIFRNLRRSCLLIQELSSATSMVDNGADRWFPVAVSYLLQALQQSSFSALLPQEGIKTFLHLSDVISKRLGSIRIFIAIATLRSYGVQGLTENFLEEDILDLVSRVLFRIKFVAGKKCFKALTLTFLLPLITKVLEDGKQVSLKNASKPIVKSEFVEEDKEEEHLLLAIEIIASHAESFSDPAIPREHILEVLLSLLSVPSKARSAKECFLALCQNISISPSEKDLDLILSNLLSANQFVRATILEAIDDEFELSPFMTYSPQVYVLMQDASEPNREIAKFIWQFNKFEVTESLIESLLPFFAQSDSGLRLFVAKAYVAALRVVTAKSSALFEKHLNQLMEFYISKARIPDPILDEYGLVVVSSEAQKDTWEERSTAAITFKELSPVYPPESDCSVKFVEFLVSSGGLGDREILVREELKEAGIEIIAHHGSRNVEKLIPVFERALTDKHDVATKENVIILYGTLARHLPAEDSRVVTILERLISTLDTPSEAVQQAVSACISPLVVLLGSKVDGYIDNLTQRLLDSKIGTSSRRGAAWGLAGLVQGFGISALSKFDVIRNLIDASEDKRDPQKRESVAFAFECLSKALGKFFEPYVIEVLPNILKNLGDSVPEVRVATANATKAIMANTTGYGIKKLIPVAVNNLDDISWRTKRGSVELLGNMAYLDPTQLSASLSTIVPEIVAVLNDSHKEVRKAADQSLTRFGEVIRNPEIQKLVPTLIKAIGDPTKYTEEALDALIRTQFVHYIDGPSLALIIHVIHRGMRERAANTKRKACKIVGNMAILVDANDLVPYLEQLVNEVEIAMVDPVPNTRATAARALGALVERLGEEQFPHLIPRLMATLSDDTKAGDRLGSAQALAEVISGLGLSKLDELLPNILAGVTHYKSYVREGFMPLLLFLPVCFGAQFAPYISQIIQPILAGLADTAETISDTSLKAGRLIVKNYATKAIDLLLPELEQGMFDENERIRLSSVQLTSDLLFQVTGISSKNEFADDEGDFNHEVTKQLVEVLGQERRDRILSSLFVCRSDTSGVVRATTVDVWKAIVPNTPRTVKEILPTLTSIIVVHLASPSASLRHIAAQTLGDLVRRVGGNALSQLLPTLENSLTEARGSDSKQGVCIALRELIQSSSPESLVSYQDVIVSIIRSTLVDDDATVRESAALSFDAFQEMFGKVAVDEVLPYLLNMLTSSERSEYALLALQEIMSTKSEVIFPILLPTLLSPPVDAFRARALGSLAEVAGFALYRRLSLIINALVNTLAANDQDPQTTVALEESLEKVMCSVVDEEGMHPLLQQILSLMKDENKRKRVVIFQRLANFFERTTLDFSLYVPEIVSLSVLSFDDDDTEILKSIFDALAVLIKKQDKVLMEKLVKPTKQALQLVGKSGEELAIFKLPKGPNCVLPVFLHGLMYGSNDDREQSAMAIADIVKRTPAANLKPFVTVITGPLIRVVGERFPGDVKAAILYALNNLFAKIPQFLRPFIPQLQRTFVKSLSDATNETLRLRAAKALGSLIEYQPRVDPLVVELVAGARQAADEGVKTAVLKALLEVVSKAGSKLNENSKNSIVSLVEEEILVVDNKLATAYAKLIGSLSEIMTKEEATKILDEKVLRVDLMSDSGRFAILTLNSFLRDAPAHILQSEVINDIVEYLIAAANSSSPYISDFALTAIGKLMLLEGERKSPFSFKESEEPFELGESNIRALIEVLAKDTLKPESSSLDSRRLALVVVRTLARFKFEECIFPYLNQLGPSIFSCLRDTIIPVKLAAEKAYLAVFKLVEEENMHTFEAWFGSLTGTTVENSVGDIIQLRSIGDYTKRVGKRLGGVERERIAAGGDPETVFSDRYEDENEIWAVGGVEIVKDA